MFVLFSCLGCRILMQKTGSFFHRVVWAKVSHYATVTSSIGMMAASKAAARSHYGMDLKGTYS